MAIRLSVLDLSPVASGMSGAEALRNTLDLARLADRLGYSRYWLAEHHNLPMIASASPELMIGHVADVTTRIRVGSGGVMLPNHAPLKVAEAFRLLGALHPGRIDLGLGRAPGTDPRTAVALRRARELLSADDFPEQLAELLGFLGDGQPEGHALHGITAMPAGVPPPPIYLLGSSSYSANLAAEWGLGFAFAHHINPPPAIDALRLYRQWFQPSDWCAEPAALLAVSAICAETDEQAETLARPADLALLRLRAHRPAPLPTAEEAVAYEFSDAEAELVRANRERLLVGSPATLRERLTALAGEARVDEVMVTTLLPDHARRRRSYELLAEAFGLDVSLGGVAPE